MTVLTLTLPIELTNGNDGRTKHFGQTAKRRKQFEATIRLMHAKPKPMRTPANITITRVLGKNQRLWDADSGLRGNAKELIDAIVAVGFLPDDGPKHVTEVRFQQDATRRHDGPSTEIKIEAIP